MKAFLSILQAAGLSLMTAAHSCRSQARSWTLQTQQTLGKVRQQPQKWAPICRKMERASRPMRHPLPM